MRQEKIKCNARERKRVNEHSMKRERRGRGGGGRWSLLEAYFLPPEEKGASLCRSIVLGFESAKKDEFVNYAIDKRYTINGVISQSL